MAGSRIVRGLLLLVIVVLVGVVAGGVFVRVSRDDGAPPPTTGDASDSYLVIPDFRHAEFDGPRRTWELRAREARFSDATHAVLVEPVIEVYREEGGQLSVEAERGEIDLGKKRLFAGGAVTARNDRGYTLTGRDFNYDDATKTLTSSEPFTLTGPDVNGSGKGLVLRTDRDLVEVTDGVAITFTPAGKELS